MMNKTIKWLRLKRIAEQISNRKIEILASTDLDANINAAVSFDEKSASVAINLANIKSVNDVINALSHELAHVVLETNEDDNAHFKKWESLRLKITKCYERRERNSANKN